MARKPRKAVAPADETKADRFRRLANARLPRAIKAIDAIGNLAGGSYERTDAQVALVVGALQAAVDRVQKAFAGESGGGVPII
jgi:hypothetical protein